MRKIIGASVFPAVVDASQALGQAIRRARQARRWTMADMAERALVSLSTYKKIEAGDPSVAYGLWLQVVYQLGLMDTLVMALSPERDALGEAMRREQEPQRIHPEKRNHDF